jgi:tetratricopeptide (TPR) repeat protein
MLKPLGASGSACLLMGRSYAALGNADSAQSVWRRAVASASSDHDAVLCAAELAASYALSGRHDEALAMWKKIVADAPYTSAAADARARLPQALVEAGQYDEAIALLRDRPEYADSAAIDLLALAHERKGDRQLATQYYHRFLRSHRTGTRAGKAYYALGGLSRSQGRNEIASAYFKQAALAGGSSPASAEIADLLLSTGQYAEAVEQYLKLAAGDSTPLRKRYQSRAIVASYKAGRLAEADKLVAQYEKSYGGKSGDRVEWTLEKANYYYGKQDYATAKKLYEKVADDGEGTPFGPWGEYYVAKITEVGNKAEDAAKRYEAILKKWPASDVRPRVLLSLGNMHFNAERFEKAITYYQQIVDSPAQAGDVLPYAMNNLIEAYESTRLYDAALKVTRDYIERYPNDESIIDKKIKVGTLYTRIGYYDQAVIHFQGLIDEAGSGTEAELRYAIGEANYYKGDYQQAILEFLKVPYLVARQGKVDWTATAFYMAGQSYEKMSKFDEAISMYQQILERPGIDATFKAGARKEIDRVKALGGKDAK